MDRGKGSGNKYTAKFLALRRQHQQQKEYQAHERELALARVNEQIMVEMCLHAEHALQVRQALDAAILQGQLETQPPAAPAQPPASQSSSSSPCSPPVSYSTRILDSLTSEMALRAQTWTRHDIMAAYTASVQQLLAALEILQRPAGYTSAGAAESLQQAATHQLEKAVADLARLLMLCHMYAEAVAVETAEAASCNLCTQQCETPDDAYHASVVQRMQLEQWQVDQVAAAFNKYQQMRRSTEAAGCRQAELLAESGSWLLARAANHDGSRSTGAACGGAGSAGFGAGAAESARWPAAEDTALLPPPPASAAAIGLATLQTITGRAQERFGLGIMAASWTLNMVLFNTLSTMQLVQMFVGCFPYLARPAPVAEAITMLSELETPRTGDDSLPAGGCAPQRGLNQHRLQRLSVLQQQQERWWQERGWQAQH